MNIIPALHNYLIQQLPYTWQADGERIREDYKWANQSTIYTTVKIRVVNYHIFLCFKISQNDSSVSIARSWTAKQVNESLRDGSSECTSISIHKDRLPHVFRDEVVVLDLADPKFFTMLVSVLSRV